ncbi:MAG: helix-turn-helix transcriptional regulator [Bacteroidota bacterium]|nr:helix-turn-helix transcriptional regulator [Bacteroidota bacterium]
MKQSDAAKLIGVSKSYISKVYSGKLKSPLADVIFSTINIEDQLMKVFTHPLFSELCDVGVSKAKNPDVRKLASLMQHWSLSLRQKQIADIPNDIVSNNGDE